MRGIKDGETGRRVQDIVMRYKYNVRELKDTDDGDIADVGTVQVMEAMSFKKLKAKLDHKKKYFVEYKNKRNNFVSIVTSGKEPK
tara:strand:- start:332 stop:586 length:255 start_codon:yes stop_codon:yes gene_type:complete